jgi:hypothetical protein
MDCHIKNYTHSYATNNCIHMIFMGKPIAREISQYQQRKYRQADQAEPHARISHIKNLSAHTDRFRVTYPQHTYLLQRIPKPFPFTLPAPDIGINSIRAATTPTDCKLFKVKDLWIWHPINNLSKNTYPLA